MRRPMLLISAVLLLGVVTQVTCAKPSGKSARSTSAVQPVRTVSVGQGAPGLALPAGAVLVSELNITEKDLLGMAKQAITSFTRGFADAGGEMGEFVKMANLDELVSCVRGVKALRVTNFRLKAKTDAIKQFSYLESQVLASKGWYRVFYSSDMIKGGVAAAYTLEGKSYLGIVIDPRAGNGYVVGTVGFVDIPKLTSWAGQAFKLYSEMEEREGKKKRGQSAKAQQPQPPSEPAPAPPDAGGAPPAVQPEAPPLPAQPQAPAEAK